MPSLHKKSRSENPKTEIVLLSIGSCGLKPMARHIVVVERRFTLCGGNPDPDLCVFIDLVCDTCPIRRCTPWCEYRWYRGASATRIDSVRRRLYRFLFSRIEDGSCHVCKMEVFPSPSYHALGSRNWLRKRCVGVLQRLSRRNQGVAA